MEYIGEVNMFDILKAVEEIHQRAMTLPYQFTKATWNLDPYTYMELRKIDSLGRFFSQDAFNPPTLTAWPVHTRKVYREKDMAHISADFDPDEEIDIRRCLYLEVEQENGRKIYLDHEITAEEYLAIS